MKRFMSIIDSISDWAGRISAFFVVVATGVITFEVVMRYVFNNPTVWGLELTVFLCGVMYVMGGAYIHYLRGHISVDLIRRRLSPRQRAIIDSIAFLFLLLLVSFIVWKGGEAAWQSLIKGYTTGTIWDPPIFPFRLVLPLGAFLLLLQGLVNFIRDLSLAIKGTEL